MWIAWTIVIVDMHKKFVLSFNAHRLIPCTLLVMCLGQGGMSMGACWLVAVQVDAMQVWPIASFNSWFSCFVHNLHLLNCRVNLIIVLFYHWLEPSFRSRSEEKYFSSSLFLLVICSCQIYMSDMHTWWNVCGACLLACFFQRQGQSISDMIISSSCFLFLFLLVACFFQDFVYMILNINCELDYF
jgi:hypothetical protein